MQVAASGWQLASGGRGGCADMCALQPTDTLFHARATMPKLSCPALPGMQSERRHAALSDLDRRITVLFFNFDLFNPVG